MKVQYSNVRHKDGTTYPVSYDRDAENALSALIECDLNFGGRITLLEPTKVVTQTRVLGDLDVTTYSGDVQAMRPIVEYCAAYLVAAAHNNQRKGIIQQIADNAIEIRDKQGMPQFLALEWATWKANTTPVRAAMAVSMGLSTEDHVSKIAGMKFKELMSAMNLVLFGGCTTEEVLAIL